MTDVTPKEYSGFTFKEKIDVNIDGNGTAVASVYYDRNEYAITFETGSGTAVAPIT